MRILNYVQSKSSKTMKYCQSIAYSGYEKKIYHSIESDPIDRNNEVEVEALCPEHRIQLCAVITALRQNLVVS